MIIEINEEDYDFIMYLIREEIYDKKDSLEILKGKDHFYGNEDPYRIKRIKELKREIRKIIELRRALKRGIK
ncbi:MAG: hypothetical protein R3331_02050 [Sulfurospirillaceae bacterium]|nr:hypothetical protein [Sulfurospirillaceae bacterium]